jgi:hypothetical protein
VSGRLTVDEASRLLHPLIDNIPGPAPPPWPLLTEGQRQEIDTLLRRLGADHARLAGELAAAREDLVNAGTEIERLRTVAGKHHAERAAAREWEGRLLAAARELLERYYYAGEEIPEDCAELVALDDALEAALAEPPPAAPEADQ